MGAMRAANTDLARVGGAAGSAPRSAGGSSAPTTLPFSLEDVEALAQQGVTEVDYDASLEIERIKEACAPASEADAQLVAAVAAIKAAHGSTIDLWALGCELRARHGYLVKLRRGLAPRQPKAYLRCLRHSFLVVRGIEGDHDQRQLVVDLGFKDAFTQAKARPWYDSLMEAVPQDFVGPLESLTLVASIMAAATRLLFRQLALPLPPWREPRTVLSRWMSPEPDAFEDVQVPLLPAPEQGQDWAAMLAPYHTPFRRAVTAATAAGRLRAAGAAAAGGSELGSAALLSGVGRGARGAGAGPGAGAGAGPGLAAGGLLRSQLQRLATREPATAVPMVLPGVAAPARGCAGGGGGCGGFPGPRADLDVPRRVIVGFPDQEHRLRRSSAPAYVDEEFAAAAAAAAAGAGSAAAAVAPGPPGASPAWRGSAAVSIGRSAAAAGAALGGGRALSRSLPSPGAAWLRESGADVAACMAEEGVGDDEGLGVADMDSERGEEVEQQQEEGEEDLEQADQTAWQAEDQQPKQQQQEQQQQQQEQQQPSSAAPAPASSPRPWWHPQQPPWHGCTPPAHAAVVPPREFMAGVAAAAAAAASGGAGAQGAKAKPSLDQLLPKMRTVRLAG